MCIVPLYVELASLKSFFKITCLLQIVLTCHTCFISAILGSNGLNSADVPLSNRQTIKRLVWPFETTNVTDFPTDGHIGYIKEDDPWLALAVVPNIRVALTQRPHSSNGLQGRDTMVNWWRLYTSGGIAHIPCNLDEADLPARPATQFYEYIFYWELFSCARWIVLFPLTVSNVSESNE